MRKKKKINNGYYQHFNRLRLLPFRILFCRSDALQYAFCDHNFVHKRIVLSGKRPMSFFFSFLIIIISPKRLYLSCCPTELSATAIQKKEKIYR